MFKDELKIPKGDYCYNEKGVCPYFSHKVIAEDVQIPYCLYLEEGDLGGLTTTEFETLKEELGLSANELWEKYPLDLLWDQVKECGINDDYEE